MTYFTLCVMILLNMWISLFKLSFKKIEFFHDILIFEMYLCLLATPADLISTLTLQITLTYTHTS